MNPEVKAMPKQLTQFHLSVERTMNLKKFEPLSQENQTNSMARRFVGRI